MTSPFYGFNQEIKRSIGVGQQVPVPPMTTAAPPIQAAETQEPKHVVERDMHRHFGRADEHHVGLRHRKQSQDPLHGEEDKLYDELKNLRDKASKGECTLMEQARLREVQGALTAIQHQRQSDAQKVLGHEINETYGSDNPDQDTQQQVTPVKPVEAVEPQPRPVMSNYHPSFPPQGQRPPTDPKEEPKAPENPKVGKQVHPGKPFRMPEQKAIPTKLDNEANETGAPAPMPNAGAVDPGKAPRVPRPVQIS